MKKANSGTVTMSLEDYNELHRTIIRLQGAIKLKTTAWDELILVEVNTEALRPEIEELIVNRFPDAIIEDDFCRMMDVVAKRVE